MFPDERRGLRRNFQSETEVGFKTRQLVEDLKTLQRLLTSLTHYDCVAFLQLRNALRAAAFYCVYCESSP
ncbi:hypothetical protein T484DRAFT_1867431 [Baffinella frigidus]|nr:hypothetical protein T484DRAFT_1867431 [Cryptophyta sp. CCMP2293]